MSAFCSIYHKIRYN